MSFLSIQIRVAIIKCCVEFFIFWGRFCDGKPTSIPSIVTTSSTLPTSLPTTIEYTTGVTSTSTQTSPLDIPDGQSAADKLKVMRLLSELEKRLETKFNTSRNDTEPREMPYIFEGDIILRPDQAKEILDNTNKRKRRKLHANLTMLWHLPIHYRFDGTHSHSEMKLIREAIIYWQELTCIRFLEIQTDNQIPNVNNVTVVFTKSTRCHSFVGRNVFPPKFEQTVAVSSNCILDGSILHEIGHVIGFWHEHSRPDRDNYVTILRQNIKVHQDFNFDAETWKNVDSKSIPYDIGSMMHYRVTEFGIGDQPTILSRDPLLPRAMGQRNELSFYDVKLANFGYCKNVCQSSSLSRPCQYEGYQDPNNCSKCRCPDGLSGQFCEEAAPSSYLDGITVVKQQSQTTSYDLLNCGGTIQLSIGQSFDFGITSYKYGRKCSWLIKAPSGAYIEFVLPGKFLNYNKCTPNPNVKCRDFVEIKYNHSLASTGARLCCSNNMTSHPITSQGNEMLVLFRSYGVGDMGFNATVLAKPCGGCLSVGGETAPPCSRRLNYTCDLVWTEKNWVSCDSGRADNNCGLWTYYNKSRQATCYRDESYCCSGYTLKGDTCHIVAVQSISTRSLNPSPTYVTTEHLKSTSETQDGYSTWSKWTNWSQPCGGCGIQSRTKSCADITICGGKPAKTEIRSCNLHPCSNNTSQVCSKLQTVTSYCGIFWPTICTKNATVTYLHRGPCCCGYEIRNNTCVETLS